LPYGKARDLIDAVLNAAVVVGLPLFGADRYELIALRRRGEEVLALLPGRVFENDEDDDDFVPDF